jgi:ribosomal protein S12 methylthiotransferase
LPDAVPEEVKQERLARFMEKQAAISAAKLRAKRGTEIEVMIDRIEDGQVIARSRADAPEIDGVVYLDNAAGLKPGMFVQARVDDSDEHDLWARVMPARMTGSR